MTELTEKSRVPSGISSLDEVIDGFMLGDNVVWKLDTLKDYQFFAGHFVERAVRDGRHCVYLRFAPHEAVLQPRDGLEIIKIDPARGFDIFSAEVHNVIEKQGREVFYVFDNLSALVVEWATDELLAAFFQVTCPFLFELDTVAYFALTRGKHSHAAVARVRDTTQLLLSVFNIQDKKYIHPLKVWGRYSAQMFLPHEIRDKKWDPVFHSSVAAEVSALASEKPLDLEVPSIAPWDSVYRKLIKFREMDPPLAEGAPEVQSLKKEFSRMMLGSHPSFDRLVDQFMTVDDLFHIRNRLIGSGRIGGKAAGMLVARRILSRSRGQVDFPDLLENHDSFYIGSDVFFTFLIDNNLFRLRLQLSQKQHYTQEDFEKIERRFLEGAFPAEILKQFSKMLDYYGQAPIIVRSSSLLEDSFGNAFAGKYRSEFCVNQGDHSARLESFVHNVKLIYASALSPDALSYRRRRGLSDRDEQMAILVQRVAGMPYRHFFFPALAGVAMSRNLYVWTKRINPQKGMVRLVFGLGTRAVNRVGNDYPRMIALSNPRLRPESNKQIPKYSQRLVDCINVKENRWEVRPISEVVEEADYPSMHLFVSVRKDGFMSDPVGSLVDYPVRELVLTFNPLIDRTDFVKIMDTMVSELERVYGQPVEIEFTVSIMGEKGMKVNLLQCRPMLVPGIETPVTCPQKIPEENVLFRTKQFFGGGVVEKIRYLIYVDPHRYSRLAAPDMKKTLGRIVGAVNAKMDGDGNQVVMIGPGRWGSSNIDLGVNVTYADIDNARALVELACEESGQVPEVSYGTHFFLDLVESQIIYLSVYPDRPESRFNRAFFERSKNRLNDIVPGYDKYADIIKLIDITQEGKDVLARIIADPQGRKTVCYLT